MWTYMRSHDVPYNPLHDRGYPSIGCAPCTRAVAAGRGRARRTLVVGSKPSDKECGLHRTAGRSVAGTQSIARSGSRA